MAPFALVDGFFAATAAVTKFLEPSHPNLLLGSSSTNGTFGTGDRRPPIFDRAYITKRSGTDNAPILIEKIDRHKKIRRTDENKGREIIVTHVMSGQIRLNFTIFFMVLSKE